MNRSSWPEVGLGIIGFERNGGAGGGIGQTSDHVFAHLWVLFGTIGFAVPIQWRLW